MKDPSPGARRRRSQVRIRVHESLNDFLPPARRGQWFTREVELSPSVKDVVESVGVPHPEIGSIVVDGSTVTFDHRVESGAEIEVFPFGVASGGPDATRLAPDRPERWRFVVDVHLGRLARWLRLLGFDVAYSRDATDAELAQSSRSDERVLLTRDRGLLKRSQVVQGYCVRHDDPEEQVVEVLRRYDLGGSVDPFTRCLDCGGTLEAVEKETVVHRLEPRTRRAFDEFHRCRKCEKVYWRGSHHERLRSLVDRVVERLR